MVTKIIPLTEPPGKDWEKEWEDAPLVTPPTRPATKATTPKGVTASVTPPPQSAPLRDVIAPVMPKKG